MKLWSAGRESEPFLVEITKLPPASKADLSGTDENALSQTAKSPKSILITLNYLGGGEVLCPSRELPLTVYRV